MTTPREYIISASVAKDLAAPLVTLPVFILDARFIPMYDTENGYDEEAAKRVACGIIDPLDMYAFRMVHATPVPSDPTEDE